LFEVELFPTIVVPLDGLRDADIGGHHGFDVVAGDELEIVDGEDVGRIGDGHYQGRAGAVDRHHPMPQGHVLGYQRDDLGVDVELRQVDGRHAVLLGQKLGQILLGDCPSLDKSIPQSVTRLSALFLCALELLRRDYLISQ
jgi:hypothetical protein